MLRIFVNSTTVFDENAEMSRSLFTKMPQTSLVNCTDCEMKTLYKKKKKDL